MKTGALMAPWCKELLAVVVGLPADGTKQSAPVGKAQAKQSGKIVPVKAVAALKTKLCLAWKRLMAALGTLRCL